MKNSKSNSKRIKYKRMNKRSRKGGLFGFNFGKSKQPEQNQQQPQTNTQVPINPPKKSFFSRSFDSFQNTSKSIMQNSSNILSGVKNITSSKKYLLTLIANPSNTHRMLFKNAHFINYIPETQVKKMYCKNKNPDCVILKDGYLYTNNLALAKEINSKKADMVDVPPEKDTNISPNDEMMVNANLDKIITIEDRNESNNPSTETTFTKELKRLDFTLLNDALLTDDKSKLNDPTTNYISFKDEFTDIFKFFHIFKMQIHRALWYMGWNDLTFIIKEMTDFISINKELSDIFLQELWGTFGLMKIFNNFSPDKIEKIKKTINAGDSAIQSELNKVNQQGEQESAKQGANEENKNDDNTRNLQQGLSKNLDKYMVIRNLLKYYDFDADQYNLNLIKRVGILKKNYPLFMTEEVKITLQIAIANLENNRGKRITKVKLFLPPKTNDTIDMLLNKLMMYNSYNPTPKNQNNKTYNVGGNKNRKNKTRKISKKGGGSLFFENVKIIFKETYHFMVRRIMMNLRTYISNNDPKRIENVAKFFAELVRCVSMMTITLCMTMLNYALIAVGSPVASPHCIISNLIFMYMLLKMRILDSKNIKIIDNLKGKKTE